MEDNYEIALANTALMVRRRGYSEILTERSSLKNVGDYSVARNPKNGDVISTYFITRNQKVSVKKMRDILRELNAVPQAIKRLIIVHDLSFTPDSKQVLQLNVVVVFDVFSYDEMMYDPLSIIDHQYELYTGPPIKEISKLPKISDVITKYLAFPFGSIVVVREFRTQIPVLYVVLKSIGEDIRKK